MRLTGIVAMTDDRGIGFQGKLPWPMIKEDMKHFKETTLGHPVIMGRKTWESIPQKFRPLPHRWNIIVTRNANYPLLSHHLIPDDSKTLVSLASSVQLALRTVEATVGPDDPVFVMGGAQVYDAAYPYLDELIVTSIAGSYECDCYFDAFNPEDWVSKSQHHLTEGVVVEHLCRA